MFKDEKMEAAARIKAAEIVKVYRTLECSGCNVVIAFQNRNTGAIYCTGDAHPVGCFKLEKLEVPRPPKVTDKADSLANKKPLEQPLKVPEPQVPKKAEQWPPSPATARTELEKIAEAHLAKEGAPNFRLGCDNVDSSFQAKLNHIKSILPEKLSVPNPLCKTKTEETESKKLVAAAPSKPHQLSGMKYSKNFKTGAHVHVVHAYYPNLFHIMVDEDEKDVEALQAVIANYTKTATPMKVDPDKGQVVLTKYDDIFYRGRVEKSKDGVSLVRFLDYGDRTKARLENIYPVNDEIYKAPIYGIIGKLRRVDTLPEGFKLSAELETMIFEEQILDVDLASNKSDQDDWNLSMETPTPDPIPVRLWDTDKENTVNTLVDRAIKVFAQAL